MPGYFKNEAATADTLIDNWLHTGDIGYSDDDGNVFIVDRKKELIKVKGLQVENCYCHQASTVQFESISRLPLLNWRT